MLPTDAKPRQRSATTPRTFCTKRLLRPKWKSAHSPPAMQAMPSQNSGSSAIFRTSWPTGYLPRKAVMAEWATRKVSSVSSSTITVSLRRSATMEPKTVVNGAFSLWAT